MADIPIDRFALGGTLVRRNRFESGWEWLTTAAHNQKWLIRKKILGVQSLAQIRTTFMRMYVSW